MIYDRDGDEWEPATDLYRNTETGALMTRDEVEDRFGPTTEEK